MTNFVSFAHNHVIALAPITIFFKEYFLMLRENWSHFTPLWLKSVLYAAMWLLKRVMSVIWTNFNSCEICCWLCHYSTEMEDHSAVFWCTVIWMTVVLFILCHIVHRWV